MKSQSIRFSQVTRIILLPLLLLLFIVLQAYGATSGQQLWVKRYNGPGNGPDWAMAIAVDSSSVYVTGYSLGSGTGFDYATIKYDSVGNKKWVKRYNGRGNSDDKAHAIAVDASGNVYVTGSSTGSGTDYDYATIKYDSAGNKKWVRRYNGPGHGDDSAYAIAVDSSGNVYVTGYSRGSGTVYDYATIKYDSAGNKKWVRRYNGPDNGYDWANAIAVDASGNVYVTGNSVGSGTDFDYATIKYDSAGNQKWVKRYNGPGNSRDEAYAIAVDSSGNVYVTGKSAGSSTGYDLATIKYDSAGNKKWVRRYNGPGNGDDQGNAIALDPSGNVYVAGYYLSGIGGSNNYLVIKYDSAGNKMWRRGLEGTASKDDRAQAMAVDSSGNVHVTGYSTGRFGTGYDYATIKWDSAGDAQWISSYCWPGNGADYAYAIAVDSSGNIYVTGGSTGSGTSFDYATIKYAP